MLNTRSQKRAATSTAQEIGGDRAQYEEKRGRGERWGKGHMAKERREGGDVFIEYLKQQDQKRRIRKHDQKRTVS